MALESGLRLGPYEIVDQIGAGGMGEVYKATDTRLQRTVAVKVLPEHLASDSQRLVRFEREAQTVSSLNHPHICALHDVGDENGTHFLVMEYVDGEALDQRLGRGPVPLDDALEYAKQIADALDKAHLQGIIHRDLKPANVMITKSGVKLLDFGLAKLTVEPESSSPLSQLNTQGDSGLTAEGTIMGTFRYMAPEQVEGKEVDARTDIYALCLVIYEMITGQRAIDGDTQASLIAAILKDKPVPITDLQPITSPQLDRVVQMGLEKDPEKRWQSAREVRHALEWIGLESSAGREQVVGAKAPAVWKAVAAVAVVVSLIGLYMGTRSTEPGRQPLLHAEIDLGANGVADAGIEMALSPDGNSLVASSIGDDGLRRLYLHQLDQGATRELPNTEGARWPFFSPDGTAVGFSIGAEILTNALAGGTVESLVTLEEPGVAPIGSWGDGFIVSGSSASGPISRFSESGGEVTPVTVLREGEVGHRGPQILPDGESVLFTNMKSAILDERSVEVVSLATGEREVIIDGAAFGHYLPGGFLVYVRDAALYAMPFDVDRMEQTGDEVRVLSGIDVNSIAFSDNGRVVFRRSASTSASLPHLLDQTGELEPLPAVPGAVAYQSPEFSPDGQRISVIVVDSTGERDLWIHDLSLERWRPFTSGGQVAIGLYTWSHDGRFIFFRSDDGIVWIRTDRVTEPKVLFDPGSATSAPRSVSHDGTALFGQATREGSSTDVWTAPLAIENDEPSMGPVEFLVESNETEVDGSLSRDGRWLVYRRGVTPRTEIWVRGMTDDGMWSIGPGIEPVWSRTDDRLFFVNNGRINFVDYRGEGPVFEFDNPEVWSETRVFAGGLTRTWDASPMEEQAVVMPNLEMEGQTHVALVTGLLDELRRLTSQTDE